MAGEQGGQPPARELLDVPSSSSLERRLLVGDAAAAPPAASGRRPRGKPPIKPVAPSGLLGRLQAFLPSMEAANAELEQRLAAGAAPADMAMERGRCVAASGAVAVWRAFRSDDEAGGEGGPVVQLDLACGLFDLKDAAAVAAAEAALVNGGVAVEAYEGGSSSGSDSDGSGEEDGEGQGGGAAGTAAAAAAAAACDEGGGDAMDEDAAEGGAAAQGPAAAAAAAAGGQAAGRRIKGGKCSKRHAGIQELS
ncbi:dentin sialophospho isoform B [Micractinium conductrix]|uniref:Dentin sialophospho isoform B n=1 Tax=Micractinium conductrix TaxID=554055 RepID=A0A2P6V5A9_9CHLO|nr:dentin sialophospho isoform B [Micractinium conductrix]|eukprot:PSC69276.1 dentin sialophospho isoform B [Micractinium conductrix]